MDKQTHQFTMSDGHVIVATSYSPEQDPIGHVHILHGMAEHQERYTGFAQLLCEEGYFVTSHDHRGHGETAMQNGELFGYFAEKDGFERVVEDAKAVTDKLRALHPQLTFTLFGHSMGSFIARRFTQHYSDTIDRAIYCGTGATTALHAIGHQLAKTLVAMQGGKTPSRIMNKLSFGSFNKNFEPVITNFDWLCSDEVEVKNYIEDMKCGFIATNQFFVDLTEGLLTIAKKQEMKKIRPNLPVLFIAGSEDPVGENGIGVFKVAHQFEQIGIQHVIVYLFEGMRHEILNERNKHQVHDVVTRWLKNEKI